MANLAILVGNTHYKNLSALECCHDDLVAVKQLLEAASKYNEIEIIENADADTLKTKIRTVADRFKTVDELFFYFTGHGFQHETEFFYCATNFDSNRPNETGLSTSELHTLFKLIETNVIVKVVDACNSGTLLVKVDGGLVLNSNKHGFKSLIQIASCLESQNSLTGKPLSLFTEKFRTAALRKRDGVIYYSDIISTLRDEFLNNNTQTPHFVSQGTGREQFVDDAKRLDDLRVTVIDNGRGPQAPDTAAPGEKTLVQMLKNFEEKMLTPLALESFVNKLFDGLISKLTDDDLSEYYSVETLEHSDYKEPTTEKLIVSVLSKEARPDNFVTAVREVRKKRAGGLLDFSSLYALSPEYEAVNELELNCSMKRAQIKITLDPKYIGLRKLVLIVTVAPSLETCYIFELGTQHKLEDFGKYSVEGDEVVRRWYKRSWDASPDGVVESVVKKLKEVLQEHLESTAKRLAGVE